MNRIDNVFRNTRKKALIAYITVGYPDIQATLKVAQLLVRNGCDIIELGIPFSDPLADGITIQNASYHALRNGVTPHTCLDIAGKLRRMVEIPIMFMTYYNPIFNYGDENFCRDCYNTGVDGLIVPDLPPDEAAELEQLIKANDMDLVYLLAPTSTEERIKIVTERSRGFVYLVSTSGVTGARANLPVGLSSLIGRVKRVTTTPVCVGFGISTPEQIAKVGAIADGVIVGSRFIQLMEDADGLTLIKNLVIEMRNSLDRL